MLCWPLAAFLAGILAWLGPAEEDLGSWCSTELTYSNAYLFCFLCPLVATVAFNLLIFCAVVVSSRERRVSRATSLYLIAFVFVWIPTLAAEWQVFHASDVAMPGPIAAVSRNILLSFISGAFLIRKETSVLAGAGDTGAGRPGDRRKVKGCHASGGAGSGLGDRVGSERR